MSQYMVKSYQNLHRSVPPLFDGTCKQISEIFLATPSKPTTSLLYLPFF